MPGHSNPSGNAFDGVIIPTTAPADSSFRTNYLPYDVFISHHGSDVKDTIAHNIYKMLDATGLRVFLDKEQLKHGDYFPETLEEAMRSASVHIAIFSKNYASSPWCMAELAYMMQTSIKFIPIFYHVEPSTLRWAINGKGLYADAFDKYQKMESSNTVPRYSPELLHSWKLALHKASYFTGEIIDNNQSNQEQAVKNVVERILRELKENHLEVAKYPVGLDEAVRDFENAVRSMGPESAQIVGIYGIGGVGKTNLAKALFNRKCAIFDRSSFVIDVGEAARQGRLHEVQKKLLEDLDLKGKYVDFDNVKEGKEIIRNRLRSVPVLLVLDGVDDPDQVNALLPARENLGQGAQIIVTTRDLGVLKASGISTTYEMGLMNPAHAAQLFRRHAFQKSSSLLGFEDPTTSFINACNNLPLSISVLGALQSSKNNWQSQLEHVCRTRPNNLKSKLRISFDALDEAEKEIFLDIACFFTGETLSMAKAVWDTAGLNRSHVSQKLVDKGLFEVDKDKRIRMNQDLRILGR